MVETEDGPLVIAAVRDVTDRKQVERAIVARILTTRVRRYRPEVRLTVGPMPPACADSRLIRHVVTNLLDNALRYTRHREIGRVDVGHEVTTDGRVTYHVRDNGAGFDMRYAHKLFQVFERLHRAEDYAGTGIGLALASRIIQRHGGDIWADATPDRGATFYFTLPDAGH